LFFGYYIPLLSSGKNSMMSKTIRRGKLLYMYEATVRLKNVKFAKILSGITGYNVVFPIRPVTQWERVTVAQQRYIYLYVCGYINSVLVIENY
jgi:hypothetical protein